MAETILSTLQSPIGITFTDSESKTVVFDGLSVIKVQILGYAEVTSKPFQITSVDNTGGSIDDKGTSVSQDINQAKVMEPTGIVIDGIVLQADALDGILAAFDDDSLLIDVQSRSINVTSLAMNDIRLSYSSAIMNGAKIHMTLSQGFPPSEVKTPEQSSDSSTVGIGVKTAQSLSATVFGLYDEVVNETKTMLGELF